MHKSILETEDYLFFKVPKQHRSLLAQFRSGILPLGVEVGRYTNVPLDERLCSLCNANAVEDELHFLCSCSLYNDERKALFTRAPLKTNDFSILDDLDKFVFMMSNMQKEVMSFIVLAVAKRKAQMYITS